MLKEEGTKNRVEIVLLKDESATHKVQEIALQEAICTQLKELRSSNATNAGLQRGLQDREAATTQLYQQFDEREQLRGQDRMEHRHRVRQERIRQLHREAHDRSQATVRTHHLK